MSEQITEDQKVNDITDDRQKQAQLENLRALNAYHVNQTQAILREATAKSFGIDPKGREQPFPGSTTNSMTVNKSGLNPWLALPLAALLPLGGYLAAKLIPQKNDSVPAVMQPNPNNSSNFIDDKYQFRIVPYASPQTN